MKEKFNGDNEDNREIRDTLGSSICLRLKLCTKIYGLIHFSDKL